MTEPPPDGWAQSLLKAAQSLTFGNLLTLAGLAVIAVPVYVIYKAVGNEALLDRLMSTYEVLGSQAGCSVRHVQERGGPDLWGISSGFAFQGEARWFVNVQVDHAPTPTRWLLIALASSLSQTPCWAEVKFTPDQCRVLEQTGVDTTGLCPKPKRSRK